ncbi:MAG: MFS transporter [Halopseudomonas aestusnigri]
MNNRAFKDTKIHDWFGSLMVFLQPRVLVILILGFSAGLPYMLIFGTLFAWLTEAGVSKTIIGTFALVGITYSIKVFWAPLADHVPLPILSLLGRRRSWMMLGQVGIIIGLLGMALTDPSIAITQMVAFSLCVAISSATQDIGIDAYRIEAMDIEYQGAMAGAYIWGWRIGALVSGAGGLYFSELYTWTQTYIFMALLMGIGVITVLIIKEPINKDINTDLVEKVKLPELVAKAKIMYVNPFVEFFERCGKMGIFILAFICLYKISDIVMGNMAIPFYLDIGFSKSEIAGVTKIFGFFATIIGAYLGAVLVMRIGLMRTLLLGSILVASTNLLFVGLSQIGHSVPFLMVTIAADNFSVGIAATALIAYLSSLVNQNYTATQYALFSSLMTLPGKLTSGFSGYIVDQTDFTIFFLYAAAMGIPAILMVIFLMRYQSKIEQTTNPVVGVGE